MIFAIETVLLCALFFLMCFLGTGNDQKNIKSYSSYPDEVQRLIKDDPEFKDKIKVSNPIITFMSNIVMFTIIFFILGIFIREKDFLFNFLAMLIMGQILNLFDFLIIDLLWWRNSKRIRFSSVPDKSLYLSPAKHFYAFLRGALCFLIVALIDGGLLMLLP